MAVSEDRTTLPESNPVPTRRPRRAPGRLMFPKPVTPLRYTRSSLLDQIEGELLDEERELLRYVAKGCDLIAKSDGHNFVLIDLNDWAFETLCAFEGGHEDVELSDEGSPSAGDRRTRSSTIERFRGV